MYFEQQIRLSTAEKAICCLDSFEKYSLRYSVIHANHWKFAYGIFEVLGIELIGQITF